MRGFRGYYREILVMARLLYGCCKTAKQVSGYYHEERRRQEAELCSVPQFFWSQLQRVLLVGHVGFRKDISWSGFVIEGEIS